VTTSVTLFPSLADSARLAAAAEAAAQTAGVASTSAVIDGPIRWTWRELDGRANAVVRGLQDAGVRPGDRIALLAAPSAAAVAFLHGLARLGAVAAPLPTGLTRGELAVAAEVVSPRLIVTGPGLETEWAGLRRPELRLEALVAAETTGTPAALSRTPGDARDRAVVILTSGTTARPKAVVLSTAAMVASAEAWLAALPPAAGWLLALGLGHVAGLGVVWRAALAGVPLIVLPRPDAAAIAATLTAEPVASHVSLVPAILGRVLDRTAGGPPPPTLRAVLLGGGDVPAALVSRALRAGWPVVPTYGLSEAGSGVTALATAEAGSHPGSAGRALPGVELRIANADETAVGEIQVRSAALSSGYLDDAAATAAARTDDGWLRTGDLGRLDVGGRLTVLDRRTDLIVRGGENISPAEVEAVLLRHPAIEGAAVVARRDAVLGQVPVAVIVLRRGVPDPGDDDLVAFCGQRLARFKVPVAFTRVDDLLLTPGGKIRRAAYRAIFDHEATGPGDHRLDRPGGVSLAYRSLGTGRIHVLLLHGTLSTAGQLTGLGRLLAAPGDLTIHAVDRRGSGDSRLADPTPIDIRTHVDDLVAILEAVGMHPAALVGVSYGGIVALEFAARRPDLALAAVAYEPPYGPLADRRTQEVFATVATATERAFATGGSAAAAEAFMRGVAGQRSWDKLPDRARAFLAAEGVSAYVDAGLRGLDPDGLARIQAPVTILTGDASEPFYRPIADALAVRIPGARRAHLPGMAHASPITEPGPIAAAIRSSMAVAGLVPPDPDSSAAEEPKS
jgi:O-succinylbenzoic acid--CoA ligase